MRFLRVHRKRDRKLIDVYGKGTPPKRCMISACGELGLCHNRDRTVMVSDCHEELSQQSLMVPLVSVHTTHHFIGVFFCL